jgi:hypothetical protein
VVACEILNSEVDEIERELVNPEVLSLIFGFFSREKVNPLLANLVVKIIGALMNTRLTNVRTAPFLSDLQVLSHIKTVPNFLDTLISHLDCASVPELLIRIVGIDSEYEGKGTVQWLVDQDFPRLMISR